MHVGKILLSSPKIQMSMSKKNLKGMKRKAGTLNHGDTHQEKNGKSLVMLFVATPMENSYTSHGHGTQALLRERTPLVSALQVVVVKIIGHAGSSKRNTGVSIRKIQSHT